MSLPYLELAELTDPEPRSDHAVVSVQAISLNRGEVRRLERMAPGTISGWDLAGTVSWPATDGTGPKAGTRVVGLKDVGAWAEQVAVPTEYLAELPKGVSFEQAATLPVAGLTALRALEIGGYVVGKRVLITGASGGVGRFAIQLAKLAGAHVTAIARRSEGLTELGADDVLPDLSASGDTFDVILDAIGGPVLGAALQRVAPRGTRDQLRRHRRRARQLPDARALRAGARAPSSTASTSSTSSSTPGRRRPTCGGWPTWSPPGGWTPRSTSPSRGPRRPARSRRCWSGAWRARPC